MELAGEPPGESTAGRGRVATVGSHGGSEERDVRRIGLAPGVAPPGRGGRSVLSPSDFDH